MLTGDIRRHSHHVHKSTNIDLLKSAVIYGSNGAGKSNLIHAVDFLKDFIIEGENNFSNESKFKLGLTTEKPTFIGVEFVNKNKGYYYGIVFNEGSILEEFLYLVGYGKKPDELVFERKVSKKGKSKLSLNQKYLKSEKNKILIEVYEDDLLDKNVPFLHLARDRKFKDISTAYLWFEKQILIIFPRARFVGLTNLFIVDDDLKTFTNDIIREFQTGVDEIGNGNIGF
ncbi:AAA family ATPase [Mucilaginibacter sp. P25]|uniref:AAA family ATPase n=1 Tax=Mucilaginibacter sp. P25 TaxID=3423945 RepID=UPI003D78C81C